MCAQSAGAISLLDDRRQHPDPIIRALDTCSIAKVSTCENSSEEYFSHCGRWFASAWRPAYLTVTSFQPVQIFRLPCDVLHLLSLICGDEAGLVGHSSGGAALQHDDIVFDRLPLYTA